MNPCNSEKEKTQSLSLSHTHTNTAVVVAVCLDGGREDVPHTHTQSHIHSLMRTKSQIQIKPQ